MLTLKSSHLSGMCTSNWYGQRCTNLDIEPRGPFVAVIFGPGGPLLWGDCPWRDKPVLKSISFNTFAVYLVFLG